MNTPWGQADRVTKWKDGLWFVSTPSHGGFRLSEPTYRDLIQRLGYIPDLFVGYQGGFWWFEEDCDAGIVSAAFPEIFLFPKSATTLSAESEVGP